MTNNTETLRDKGFRFVLRGDGKFNWIHPAEVRADDDDCTDMNDAEFEWFVSYVYGENK